MAQYDRLMACVIRLPLPKEVPMAFRVLPEYALEDVVDYLVFVVQCVPLLETFPLSHIISTRNAPDSLELTGRTELLLFALTFLTSTWYIKNPFLKSKINDVPSHLSNLKTH